MQIYNKLVRDNILDIMATKGLTFESKILNKVELEKEIKEKMVEEAIEYKESITKQNNLEELADILELVYTALKINNSSMQELEKIRLNKKVSKGGFEQGYYLIQVEDQ